MDGRWSEVNTASGASHQFGGFEQVEIDELAASLTKSVIVPASDAIVPAGSIAEGDLTDQPRLSEKMQGIVDGRVTDGFELATGSDEYLIRRRMPVALADCLQHYPSLRRQPVLHLSALCPYSFHRDLE